MKRQFTIDDVNKASIDDNYLKQILNEMGFEIKCIQQDYLYRSFILKSSTNEKVIIIKNNKLDWWSFIHNFVRRYSCEILEPPGYLRRRGYIPYKISVDDPRSNKLQKLSKKCKHKLEQSDSPF